MQELDNDLEEMEDGYKIIYFDDDVLSEQIDTSEIEINPITYKSWKVYLDNDLIDTVLYPSNFCDRQVRCRLIINDYYPIEIDVIEE